MCYFVDDFFVKDISTNDSIETLEHKDRSFRVLYRARK